MVSTSCQTCPPPAFLRKNKQDTFRHISCRLFAYRLSTGPQLHFCSTGICVGSKLICYLLEPRKYPMELKTFQY